MRIFHVITGLNVGGAEMLLCQLLETLRPPAFEHTVIALLDKEGVLSRRVAKSAELHHLGMRAGWVRLKDLWRLRRYLHNGKPDVVQAWMFHANLMATLTSLWSGIPVVWGVHQSLDYIRGNKLNTRVVICASRALSRFPDRIVYCSSVSADQCEAFGFHQVARQLIPNGFDTERFRPDADARVRVRNEFAISEDNFVIGLVARWHAMKDHDNFLQAATLFVREHSHALFLLVGDGLDAGNKVLTDWIQARGLVERVRLCGRRSDLAAVNAALDVASSSSAWGEAFPMALGEAMACGVPCVATDVGDVRQIIGDTGVVVPPRNPAALCTGWEKLAGMSRRDRDALGVRVRQRIIERYSLASVARQYADLYLSVSRRR